MSSSNTKNILDEFFQNLKDFGDRLSMEDIDVAVESLQIAFDDLRLMKKQLLKRKKKPNASNEKKMKSEKKKKKSASRRNILKK